MNFFLLLFTMLPNYMAFASIDEQQNRIDFLDGKKDKTITDINGKQNQQATYLFFQLIDTLQHTYEANEIDYLSKVSHARNIEAQLEKLNRIDARTIDRLTRELSHLLGALRYWNKDALTKYLMQDELLSLQSIWYYKDQTATKSFLFQQVNKQPAEVLRSLKYVPGLHYQSALIDSVTIIAPDVIKTYLASRNSISYHVWASQNTKVQTVVSIYNRYRKKTDAYCLLPLIYTKKIDLNKAHAIAENEDSLFHYLLDINKNPNFLASFSAEKKLRNLSLKKVRVLNDLHLEKNSNKRFASVKDLSVEQLYTLMVYSPEEIFTSTFNGLFNLMVNDLDSNGSMHLLEEVNFLKLRTFIKLSAGFGKLQLFLDLMDEEQQASLLFKFVNGIETDKNPLENAVDVADSFGSIKDSSLLAKLKPLLTAEFERVYQQKNISGIALYEILSDLLNMNIEQDSMWANKFEEKYQLSSIDRIKLSSLFYDSTHYQHHLFFDDDDGIASFNSFLASFKDANWQIKYFEHYVLIKSKSGNDVHIYANKAKSERIGQQQLNLLFDSLGIKPTVLMQRGHSFYVPTSIQQIKPYSKIVILGSCGGYHNLSAVVKRSAGVHIVSSKQIGTMLVNNVLAKQLAETIRTKEELIWKTFWDTLESKLYSASAKEKFEDYIPPHENLGSLFIEAYSKQLQQN